MDKEILNALIEMIRSGGTLAIWGIVTYSLMQILKIAVTGGILCWIVSALCSLVKHCWDNYQREKATRVSLLSQDLTTKFTEVFSALSAEITTLLRELRTQFEDLRNSSAKK